MTTKFRVAQDAVKGRAALATRRLAPGTQLLVTSAFAAVSLTACNWCFSTATLKRCGGCQLVKYCSRQCQQLDWARGGHGSECAAWKTIPSGRGSQTVLLVARLAAKVLLRGHEDAGAMLALRHHYDDHTASTLTEFETMAQLVGLVLARSKFNAQSIPFDELMTNHERAIVELFCRVNCNAFTICDDVNVPVGIGMFPEAALLNHSCVPNCVVSFAAPQQLRIHVVSPVEADEELTISYVELFESTPKRMRALRNSYFFACSCERCQLADRHPREDWLLDGFVCGNDACKEDSGVIVVGDETAACPACGYHDSLGTIQDGQLRLAELEQQLPEDLRERWTRYQQMWALVSRELRCHPCSAKYAETARKIGNFLVDHGEALGLAPTAALEYFERELLATKWVLPSLALPSRGLLYFQLAKLSLLANDDEKATLYIRETLAVLNVAYGSDHRMVHAAREFLRDRERS